jgi:ElaB/YqjD/DUF883 family membrane-anchored ribosome-binding protein
MKSIRAGTSRYENEVRSATAQALESTRDYANQALEKAGERVRGLSYGVRDLANEYGYATTRYVSDQPLKSALIAAALGAAVAALLLAMRRSSSRRFY